MEREEFFIFIIISIVIFAGWYLIAMPMLEPAQTPQKQQKTGEEVTKQKEPEGERTGRTVESGKAATVEKETSRDTSRDGEKTPGQDGEKLPEKNMERVEVKKNLVLENDLIRTTWTNKGAGLVAAVLKEYRSSGGEEGNRPRLTLLRDFQEGRYGSVLESVTIESGGVSEEYSTSDIVYRVAEKSDDRIVFRGLVGDRLQVQKTVSMPDSAYNVEVDYRFKNRSDRRMKLHYKLRGPSGIAREIADPQYLGTRIGLREGNEFDMVSYSLGDLPGTNRSANITWAAVVSHYFTAAVMPEENDWIKTVISRPITPTRLKQKKGRWEGLRGQGSSLAKNYPAPEVVIVSAETELSGGGSLDRGHRLVMAPKDDAVLATYGAGLTQVIYFGWIPFLGRFMLGVLRWFYYLIPNYGVAIILLTLVVRGGLYPLTRKSQISMAKMQKLQPKIQELREKYGDDSQKMGREQMKLFRKYGVSPMSGCLPLLLQFPVFIALYGALRAAIELRQAGFLWIADLSRPDTLFALPFDLPIFGHQFNLLPFLAAGAMYMNQKLMHRPSSGGPQAEMQQTMMKFMPAFLLLVFYQLPSGLTLYITTSMGVGMAQQWLIRRHVKDIKLKPVDEEDSSGGSSSSGGRADRQKKPSGLMGRLMKWVEEQEKQSRQLGGGDKNK